MDKLITRILEFQKDKNENILNKLISEYKPFITSTVSKVTGRYINSENSEEYILGLEAFHEAIVKYDIEKGAFIGFTEVVIKNRVKDYLAKENKHNERNVKGEYDFAAEVQEEYNELAEEILYFEEKLNYFGIEIEELIENSPKHKKTRVETTEVGKSVATDQPICQKLYKTKKLPMAEIVLKYNTTKKRLKTYRNFIISIVIIIKEDLGLIKPYIEIGSDVDV